MKRFFTKPAAITSILSLVVALFIIPHHAHAGWFSLDGIALGTIQRLIMLPFELYILPLAAGIMYLCGLIMDIAIQFSINTAYIFSLSPAINLGWVIIRDIANIFFIFILIWISLGTIINGTRFGTMNMLKNVIIAAILINFSLFITKAVVDVSNIFGNWLYQGVQNTLVSNSSDRSSPVSLSGLIATRLGIIGFWSATTNANAANAQDYVEQVTDGTKGFIGVMLRLIIVCTTSYIFLYCAILFISRSITILFLLVFSPLGFMGGVLPQLKKHAGDWKEELLSAAVFPLATLLMLYIALQFINSLGNLGGKLFDAKTNSIALISNFTVAQFFQYFLVIFLLRTVLKIAKENSGEMGKTLGGIADSLGKLAVTAVTTLGIGGVAMGTRVLARGGLAAAAAQNGAKGAAFKKAAIENLPPILTTSKIGKYIKDPRKAMDAAQKTLKSGTLDIRNIGTDKTNVGSLLSGSLSSTTDAKIDAKAWDKKELGAQTAAWAEERKIAEADENILKDIEGDLKKAAEDLDLITKKLAMDNASTALKNGTGTAAALASAQADYSSALQSFNGDAKVQAAKLRIADQAQKLGNKELEKLDKKILGNEVFLQTISQSQVDHLADKQESDAGKQKIWATRLSDVNLALKSKNTDEIKKAIRNHSDEELQNLSPGDLRSYDFINPKIMDYDKFDKLMKNKKLPGVIKADMKKTRYQDLDAAILRTNGPTIEMELDKLEENEIAKLGWKDRLDNFEVSIRMTPKTLSKAIDELDSTQRAAIKKRFADAARGVYGALTPNADANVKKVNKWFTDNPVGESF